MSHITVIKTQIRDLAALEEALKAAFPGARLVRGATSFHSYQGSQPCDHKIHVDGVSYEIGLVHGTAAVTTDREELRRLPPHLRTQKGFNLHHDFYGSTGSQHDGHRLREKFGDGCGKLVQEYAAAVTTKVLRAKGCMNIRRRARADGTIVIRAAAA